MNTVTYSTKEAYLGPILQYDNGSKLWRLVADYCQEWESNGSRKRLFMAAGYEYDKASTPKILPRIMVRYDEVWEGPSLWHDRLYQEKGRFPDLEHFRFETKINGIWKIDTTPWRRTQADDWLEQDCLLAGASPWEAREFKWAVKLYSPNWFKGF